MGSRLESNSNAVRKRIQNHSFDNEEGEEYEPSKFGGFPEYFRRKKIKLQNLDAEFRSQTTSNPQLFRGVVAHVNGYTQPSLNDLHKLIVGHGGGFMQYLDGKTTVTHIICSNLTLKKAVDFKRYRIVKPAWVVDSIAAGDLLPWDNYRVLSEGVGQKVLGFDNGKVISHTERKARGYKEESDRSWYTSQLKGIATQHVPTSSSISNGLEPYRATSYKDDHVTTSGEGQQSLATVPNDSVDGTAGPMSPDAIPKLSNEDPNTQMNSVLMAEDSLSALLEEPAFTPASSGRKGLIDAVDQKDDDAFEANDTKNPTQTVETLEPTDTRLVQGGKEIDSRSKRHKFSEMENFYNMIGGPAWAESDEAKRTAKMTAEERNAELLADPRIRKSTVVNPDFLEQYYRESRLHHLSTWKADLKSQLQAMANTKSASQKQRKKRAPGARRYILHVDFDSFFAAVSMKKHPQFTNKPAVVAHGSGSGSEIASCNYAARKFGVKNGMWMRRARDLCPDINVMPYDFPAYEEASKAFYEAILSSGGLIQSVSIDEALVDITDTCLEAVHSDGKMRAEGVVDREQSYANDMAQKLRDEVLAKTGCHVSVGIGGNILLAKVALRKAKPAGQYQILPDEILDFVGRLEVEDLPGVAYSIGGKLAEIGAKYVRDVREISREKLINTLGPKTGEKIWEYARGIDRAEVGDVVVRKSVSAEVNWGVRFETQDQVVEFMESLCGELEKRLLKEQVTGKQLTVKVMKRAADAPLDPPKHLGHGKCDTFNKSCVLTLSTNSKEIIAKEALATITSFGFSPGELRGLGVQMTKLEPVKAKVEGTTESGQRRLQFRSQAAPKSAAREHEDPILDETVTPKKPKQHPDDIEVGFGADQLQVSTPSRKPLNIAGTQFVVPTQIDPEVLSELPDDIRLKIAQHIDPSELKTPRSKGIGSSSTGLGVQSFLPNQSQIDLKTLNDLPAHVRKEILEFYDSAVPDGSPTSRQSKLVDQSVLPQSPRKIRTLVAPKRTVPASNVMRKRGRPSKFAASAKGNSTLTQSNFITARARRAFSPDGFATSGTDTDSPDVAPEPAKHDTEDSGQDEDAEPSAEFLAALPEDIRREVLDEQRRLRIMKKSGLQVNPRSRMSKAHVPTVEQDDRVISEDDDEDDNESLAPQTLTLPARVSKPTFTLQQLSDLSDLREAVSAWWEEFRAEGPYEEDVTALATYLEKVVVEERDLSKAVGVAKWMAWVVVEGSEDVMIGENNAAGGKMRWMQALEKVKEGVKRAIKVRGLSEVDF